jgi:hypothetical protein
VRNQQVDGVAPPSDGWFAGEADAVPGLLRNRRADAALDRVKRRCSVTLSPSVTRQALATWAFVRNRVADDRGVTVRNATASAAKPWPPEMSDGRFGCATSR